MMYKVEYLDDEKPIRKGHSRWTPAVFSIDKKVDDETYRAMLGCQLVQPDYRTTSEDINEVTQKKEELIKKGWKVRIVKVTA